MMIDNNQVKISLDDFNEVISTLKTSKRYIEMNPENGGPNGAAGQIDELIQRLLNGNDGKNNA